MKHLSLTLGLLFSFSPLGFGACGGSADFHPLLCRGGGVDLRIVDQTTKSPDNTYYIEKVGIEMTFRKNPEAAHAIGTTLRPGHCAFQDRPLNATEPRFARTGFGQRLPQYPPSARLFMAQTISQCNNNPSCVFVLCVKGAGTFFDTLPSWLDVKYPF